MNHEKNTQYTALYIRSAIHVPYASKACLIQQSSRKITKSTKVNKGLFNQYNLSSKLLFFYFFFLSPFSLMLQKKGVRLKRLFLKV